MKMKVAKRKIKSHLLIGLCAGLLLGSSPAYADSSHRQVSMDNGRITVSARNIDAQDLLNELVALSGITVVQHAPLQRSLTVEFEHQALSYAIREILANDSYQFFEPRDDRPDAGILWIFSEGTSATSLATEVYESVLMKGDVRSRLDAVRALRKLGTADAVAALSLATADADEDVRIAAIRALGRVGGEDALAAIASLAMDEDPWIRSEAAEALANAGGVSSGDYLGLAMQDLDPMVRAAVVESLVDEHGANAMQALTDALSDPDANVRMMAVDALEEIGGHGAYAALSLASDDPDPEVREAVRESLQLLGQQ
jgi:hypothetical protein